MPIYEYKCEKCHAEFELLIKNSNTPVYCAKCGSRKVNKLLSGFSAKVSLNSPKKCSISDCKSCCPGGSCNHQK